MASFPASETSAARGSGEMGRSTAIRVRIEASHSLIAAALAELVRQLGLEATTDSHSPADVALVYSTAGPLRHQPAHDDVPSLALIHGGDDEMQLGDLLLKGYAGYLRPDTSPVSLARALESAADGEIWAEQRVVLQALARPGRTKLTRRQEQVLRLVVRGCSNQEIANELGISLSTVKAHVTTLLEKHGVRSRLLLIARYTTADH